MLKVFKNSCSQISLFAVAILITSTSCGCMMMSNKYTSDPEAPTTTGASAPYTVELHKSLGSPSYFHGQLDELTTVQTALEQSGAIKNYRNMKVDLIRRVPEKSTVLKLPIEFDAGADKVAVETDYQLHIGDRLVVKPSNSGPMDSAMRIIGLQ